MLIFVNLIWCILFFIQSYLYRCKENELKAKIKAREADCIAAWDESNADWCSTHTSNRITITTKRSPVATIKINGKEYECTDAKILSKEEVDRIDKIYGKPQTLVGDGIADDTGAIRNLYHP